MTGERIRRVDDERADVATDVDHDGALACSVAAGPRWTGRVVMVVPMGVIVAAHVLESCSAGIS